MKEICLLRREKAHVAKDFLHVNTIWLKIRIWGTEKMNTNHMLTNSGKGVITYKDGSKIIIDKDKYFILLRYLMRKCSDLMPTRGVIFSFSL
jgi:hypothetical protein